MGLADLLLAPFRRPTPPIEKKALPFVGFVGPSGQAGEAASGFSVIGGIPDVDYLDSLSFPEFLEVYRRMANDPQVATELRSNTLPLLSAEWDVEPATDDARDTSIAEFVAANLYQREGKTYGRAFWMEVQWIDRLRDILRFLQNGFAVFQKVRRQEGRFTVYAKLKYLVPHSIERWVFDEVDNLQGLLRTYRRSDGVPVVREPIMASELAVYTWDREGSNLLGKPILRSMYKDHKLKELLEKLQVIDKQKTAVGLPLVVLPENPGPDDQQKGQDLAKAMRGGNLERLWACVPHGTEVKWAEGGQSNKGVPELIEQKNLGIAKAGGGQFLELGLSGTSGSRGVGGVQGSFAGVLMTAVARSVAAQENQLLVRELVDLNFQNVSVYPRVKVSNVDPMEKTMQIPDFVDAITKPGLDLETENEIRKRYGFMERVEGSAPLRPATAGMPFANAPAESAPPRPGVAGPSGEPRQPNFQTPAEVSPQSRASGRRFDLALASPEEVLAHSTADPLSIRRRLQDFEDDYLLHLKAVASDAHQHLVEQVAAGQLKPRRARDVKVPFTGELRERLSVVVKAVRDFGRQEIRRELERQALRSGQTTLAADPASRSGAVSYANQQGDVVVNLDVDAFTSVLQQQVTDEYNRLSSQGLDDRDVAAQLQGFLSGLSDKRIRDMARRSTATAFNLGRNVTIQELRAKIEPVVVRTEVINENTCGPCERLKGKRVRVDSPEYLRYMPPSFCEGRDNCRGFYLAFPR